MTDHLRTLSDTVTASPDAPHDRSRRRRRSGSLPATILKHVLLSLGALVMIYPLLWMIYAALRPEADVFRPITENPQHITISNFRDGWNALADPFGLYLWNSTVITVAAIVGNLLTCSMAAYAFARLKFRGRRIFFGLMLMSIMLPFHVLLVPQYVLFSTLQWVDSPLALIVPKFLATDAFFVFLMVQFMRNIPRELEEAATLDGAGHFRIFTRVILPLCVPALATTTIFTFIWTWNDFMGPLIYLTSSERYTVQIALRSFVDSSAAGGSSWAQLFAMSLVSLLPVFLAFLFGQRFLINGIATTGGK